MAVVDFGFVVIRPYHISGSFAAGLAWTDVDDGRAETRGFDNSTGTISDEDGGVGEQAEECFAIGIFANNKFRRLQRFPASNNAGAAGVVVGIDDDGVLKSMGRHCPQDNLRAAIFRGFISNRADVKRAGYNSFSLIQEKLLYNFRKLRGRSTYSIDSGGTDFVNSPFILAEF